MDNLWNKMHERRWIQNSGDEFYGMIIMQNRRTSKGKQKIEMKEIIKDENLKVIFSRRKAGICRKASELCIMCDTNLATVIFSPSGKPYSFASPNYMRLVCDSLFKRDLPPDPNQAIIYGGSEDGAN
ncbi:hypothetical protein LguiA_033205 [Lonicera macranthoides]